MEITWILARVLPALVIVGGGIYALKMGRQLYLKGIGLSPDGSVIETTRGPFKLKASLKNVGASVMLTSVVWAFIGYLALPKELSIARSRRVHRGVEEC